MSKAETLKNQEEPKNTKIINIDKGFSLNNVEIDNDKKDNGKTIFHITENYLNEFYFIRYNEISLELEFSPKDKIKWASLNENSLWIELKKKGINVPITSLIAILKSDFIENFNPLKAYFVDLPKWNEEKDYISEFANYIKLESEADRDQFNNTFKKWLVRTVKCAIEPYYFNKQAFILSDDGNGQNIGKTSWCRFICPPSLSNYIAEDISNDKDSRILLCKNFLINLDELSVLSRRDINQLKAYFSKEQVNERLPYDRKSSIIPRVASFIGSTNMSTFLQDETGSVRWIVFTIKNIDWSYKAKFKIDNLWAQSYFLAYHDKNFNEIFTPEDIKENEIRNIKYTVLSPERELINKYFKIPKSLNDTNVEFLTATEILVILKVNSSLRLSSVGIGKGLKASGFERVKSNGAYGYYVEKTNSDFSNGFNFSPKS